MASSAPTILRTEHKFGDYLSQPDLARFELPRKMSRPWIVNKTYETEKMEHIRGTEDSGDKKNVFHKIKQSKNEKRKMVGGNKKYVRNINDIIASDHDNVTAVNTNITTTTNTPVLADNHSITWNTHHQTKFSPKKAKMNTHDAIDTLQSASNETKETNSQENDDEMDERKKSLERDIELEQQQLMNRMYNNPSTFDSSFVSVGLMPVMVHNPAGGYYIVHLPLQSPPAQFPPDSIYSTSSSYPVSHSYTSSSISSSDEGFVDDNESNDDAVSLVEAFDEKLEISEEESDEDEELNRLDIEKDEELNRLVLSIIDDD